ncbi:MAG: SPOR domain-containing protein, partial [Proteiniphilum sp.]|nr:SPOR domain-containing protein [Proteiniphilum sp.]
QRTSRNEATRKQHLIESAFPQYETVVLFESPFWRLRVGNFEDREQAAEVMKEIRSRFPSFGKEMYIVVDEVKIPLQRGSDSEDE